MSRANAGGRHSRLAVARGCTLAAGIALASLSQAPGSRLSAQTYVLVVSGLGGEAKYSKEFAQASIRLADALHTRFGIPDSCIVWLGEDSVKSSSRFGGQSTKANLERAVQRMAMRAAPSAQFVLVLIGHGSGDGADSRISLPGPDPTASDFAQMLARFPTQKIAFVDLTSASGDMLPVVSGPNRVIITATKSAFERNESHFAHFFVEALANDVADTDKDGRVSLLEAFRYAAAETKRLYETDGKLMTEHAQLDDLGEKQGTADPTGRGGQGMFARRFFLDAGLFASRAGGSDPRLSALYGEKFAIEDQLETLRQKKTTMTADAYDAELERLLIALARKAREIRGMEGR